MDGEAIEEESNEGGKDEIEEEDESDMGQGLKCSPFKGEEEDDEEDQD